MASIRSNNAQPGRGFFGAPYPTTAAQSAYDFEHDPWLQNAQPNGPNNPTSRLVSNPEARGSRPLTWGGYSVPSTDASPTAARPQELLLPPLFGQAWQLACSADAAHHPSTSADPRIDPDISLAQLHRLLTDAGETAATAERILNLCCTASRCSRHDFFLALVLLRYAQSGESLDAHRAAAQLQSGHVESPTIDLDSIRATTESNVHTFPPPNPVLTPRPPGPMREMSDPWNTGSNAAAATAAAAAAPASTAYRDGLPSSSASGGPASVFRSFAFDGGESGGSNGSTAAITTNGGASEAPFGPVEPPRSSDGPPTSLGLSSSRLRQGTIRTQRPFSYVSDSAEVNAVGAADDPEADLPLDEITVRLRSELEGFLIKHNVYVVSSELRQSSVIRRYSDWVWLADCLVKRYPFRCLPLLPPKRISLPMAGRHLSGDDQFIERRRRGLERYLRVLSSHPVLRQDRLVDVFMTEKRPLSEWRQTAPPLYLDEEGLTKVLDEVEQMSIPEDLDAKLAQQRRALPDLLERWTSTVALFERMVRRNDAAAADFSRFNFGLLSLAESSDRRWRPESDSRRGGSREAAEGCLRKVGEAYQAHSDLVARRSSREGGYTLESLKHQRDLVAAFRDLFIRLDRLLPDQVDALRKRMEGTTKKAAQMKKDAAAAAAVANAASTSTSASTAGWEEEYGRLMGEVARDGETVRKLLGRRVHVRKTLWEELVWFHWRYVEVDDVWKAWARDNVVVAAEAGRNWEVLGMKLDM
ncbi:related to Sorting nexin MVP1 [Pseudozyma flocculosa]|uniref:Sorting nexin MVP1 n=1 Tax=Pseudozyma flocculosa TaxID=84751 RepID=A0A5C3F6R0_9BASI|nr:related to Sorting nexin MVP1 [Pseudozyma flocculosa]